MKVTRKVRREMRELWPEFTLAQIAARYGVAVSTVSRQLRGHVTRRRRVSDQDVMEMRAAFPGMTYAQIAEKWGFTPRTVCLAVTWKTHKHLLGAHTGNNRRGNPEALRKWALKPRKINVHLKLTLHRL